MPRNKAGRNLETRVPTRSSRLSDSQSNQNGPFHQCKCTGKVRGLSTAVTVRLTKQQQRYSIMQTGVGRRKYQAGFQSECLTKIGERAFGTAVHCQMNGAPTATEYPLAQCLGSLPHSQYLDFSTHNLICSFCALHSGHNSGIHFFLFYFD